MSKKRAKPKARLVKVVNEKFSEATLKLERLAEDLDVIVESLWATLFKSREEKL